MQNTLNIFYFWMRAVRVLALYGCPSYIASTTVPVASANCFFSFLFLFIAIMSGLLRAHRPRDSQSMRLFSAHPREFELAHRLPHKLPELCYELVHTHNK